MDILFNFLKQYDGTTDPKEFVRAFKLQSAMLNWNDAKQLSLVSLFLKGKALRVYENIQTKESIEDVLEAIIQGCAQPKEIHHEEFYQRKIRSDESITQFAMALQDLLQKAIPGMKQPEQAVLLKAQLCESLPDHLKALVKFSSEKSWDEILNGLEKVYPNSQFASADINWSEGRNTSSKFVRFNQNQRYAPSQHKNNKNIPNKTQQRLICSYCGKPNHKAFECRSRLRDLKQNQNPSQPSKHTASNEARMASANEHTVETPEFPFCFTEQAEASTISIASLNTSKTELLKVKAELSFNAISQIISIEALVDG